MKFISSVNTSLVTKGEKQGVSKHCSFTFCGISTYQRGFTLAIFWQPNHFHTASSSVKWPFQYTSFACLKIEWLYFRCSCSDKLSSPWPCQPISRSTVRLPIRLDSAPPHPFPGNFYGLYLHIWKHTQTSAPRSCPCVEQERRRSGQSPRGKPQPESSTASSSPPV